MNQKSNIALAELIVQNTISAVNGNHFSGKKISKRSNGKYHIDDFMKIAKTEFDYQKTKFPFDVDKERCMRMVKEELETYIKNKTP